MTLSIANGWTIVFDLDGTLVDTAPDLIVAVNHALTGAGHAPIQPAVLYPAVSLGARRMIEVGLEHQGKAVDVAAVDAMTKVMLAYYTEHVAVESRPYPGLVEILETLAGHGATLAVCTNKMEVLSLKLLRALDLERHFAAICGRDTFPVCKPHPGHLFQTISAARGEPQRAVMIGDSDVDIATAKAARVPVVGMTHGYCERPLTEFEPDVIIDDFAGLGGALVHLMTRPG